MRPCLPLSQTSSSSSRILLDCASLPSQVISREKGGGNLGADYEESAMNSLQENMETRKFSSVDGSIYRRIATFTSSSLLSLVNLAKILFRFIVGRPFRINSREESRLSEPEELNQELPAKERGEESIDENVERRMLSFSFKHQTQNLEDNLIMTDKEEQKDETENSEEIHTPFMVSISIHNFTFLSDKDVSRLMEEAENIAFHVLQLLASFDENTIDGENTEIRFLYAEDFLKPPVESTLEEEDGNNTDYKGLSSLLLNKRGRKEDFLELKFRLYEEEKSNSLTSETNSMEEGEYRFISGSDFESDTVSSSDCYSMKEEHDLGNREQDQHKSSPLKDLDTEEAGKGAYDLANSSNAFPEKKADPYDDAPKGVVRKKTEESEAPYFDEEFDELWEHEEIIEQLKMELKKVRAADLPTIPEESDNPRGIEDLKPFRIDLNILRKDPLDDELQNVYRSYSERMRKFDTLNDQKLYAMGIMQMKNPTHSFGMQGKLFSTVMSHFSKNLFFCNKKFKNAPSKKLIEDLQRDLETVYVGQTCLSWEFLRWQYEKTHELLESDPRRSRQYNHVADEFQQFQVLIQRFTENEEFQGPRLQNYVHQRYACSNLLQVPFMKEDCLNEDMENRASESAVIGEMLKDIMEEAINIFWEFVKAEKHKTTLLPKILIKNNAEVQDPSDHLLMEEIQSDLHKKEKKLKDLQRSGNCIVKKFKKPQEDRSNQDLFFSQIDLKLVSRVLKMSRISSDQLSWCQRKLSKINFSPGKVHRAPSFLLFPC